ncbi:hypothetical protein KPL78_29695 [Roseomonas sp. HJA6]|uniref:DnaA N-terminal domain-containing protein n=1 Tax=Roseomonas alba TaxID=2846776 RepID=A0ABS7AIA5_9PROT|nr:DnaA N-terminal domain-containing protein [Neoroseomonas alba]MBW6402057.1 hypothetical protein [Neoroseomonas alba]
MKSLFPKDMLPKPLRADFEAFWNAYPRRNPNPRANAETAFAQAVKQGAGPEDLVRAADAYATECRSRGIGSEFIVHASTFLRQRRFLDYLRAPVAEAPVCKLPAIDHPLWHRLQTRVSEADFRRWMQPLRCVSLTEGSRAVLLAPTRFHRDWVRQHFDLVLKAGLGVRILDIEIAEDLRP